MAKPADLVLWVPGNEAAKMTSPSGPKRDLGWESGEKPAFQTMNYLQNNWGQWLAYFEVTTDDHESRISLNEFNIDQNSNDISNNSSNISTNSADIATNVSNIATNAANISTNSADIATNAADIATNAADIATNTSDISSLTADDIANDSTVSGATVKDALENLNSGSSSPYIEADPKVSSENGTGPGTWAGSGAGTVTPRYKYFGGAGGDNLFFLEVFIPGNVSVDYIDGVEVDLNYIIGPTYLFTSPCIVIDDTGNKVLGHASITAGFLIISLSDNKLPVGSYSIYVNVSGRLSS